jgi:hypothetical protein
MTAGARPGLEKLYREFGDRVQFVSVYVREAHPGENYPHHTNEEQKMHHARDWARQDHVPWPVAVDTLEGTVHRAYLPLPNPVYLIDSTGHVAFRALWAGQHGLLQGKLEELLVREVKGVPLVLGEQENLVIPMINGSAEFDYAVGRGGKKAKEDFRRAMGNAMYGLQKLMSAVEPILHPGHHRRGG